MTRVLALFVLSVLLALPGLGQDEKAEATTLQGFVVDAMCAKGMMKKDNPMKAAAMHTKSCALEEGCAESGFGVFSDGKYYKFDESGDEMALKLINGSETQKGMMVEVKGMQKGDEFAVAELRELTTGKSDPHEGHEGHNH